MWILLALAYLSSANAKAAILVQISNISDFTLPTWGIGDPAVSQNINVCVYSVGLIASDYAITVSSSGGYALTSGSNSIPYSLYWEDSGAGNLGSSGGTQLSNGVKLTGQTNANILSPLCALGVTGPTARLTLKIAQTDMTAAPAGTYSGTITLLVSPN
jgi:hypothetical protein